MFDFIDWLVLREQQNRQADIALLPTENMGRYDENETSASSYFFPSEMREDMEGEQRFEDGDGSDPRGLPSSVIRPQLDGTMGQGDHDYEGQTPHGFQQHEADYGNEVRDINDAGRQDSVLGTSPTFPEDGMGRASSVRLTARQHLLDTNLKRTPPSAPDE